MRQEDAKLLACLEQTIFSDNWSEQGIVETWQQKHSIILVARENTEIRGYLIAYHVLDEVEIVRLAVLENARGQGIGSELLTVLLETKHICNILLEVREHNEVARTFYQQHGFVEVGLRKHFYQNPTEHAILMKRELAQEIAKRSNKRSNKRSR